MIAEVLEVISPRPVVTILEVFKGISLVSTVGGGPVSSVFGRVGAVVAVPTDYTPAFIGAEPGLGNPASNGLVLSSTTTGTRSWVTFPTALVSSVFGRTGVVVAQTGDYTPVQVGAEPALGNPSVSGQVLSSTTVGVRSWITPPSAPVSSVFGRTGAVGAQAGDYTAAQVGAEPALGNPSIDGYVLSSTTTGTRSWIVPPSAPVSSVFGRTGVVVAQAGDYSFSQINGVVATTQAGLPAGGSAGQVLQKNSGTDYDTGWVTLITSSQSIWNYKNIPTMADPGNGNIRFNNALFGSATVMAISVTSQQGVDRTNLLKSLQIGDVIEVQDQTNAANWIRYNISAAPVNNTTWFQIPIASVVGSGSNPTNNDNLLLTFNTSGGGGGVGVVSSVFGRTGAVVAVNTDYTPAFIGAEPALGSPSTNGQVLSSTTGGTRSWISLPTIAHTTDFLSGDGAGNAVDSVKVVPTGAVVGATDTQTVSNKRVTKRTGTVTSSATPSINTDNVDEFTITALATAITSMTTGLSGTPTEGQVLLLWIKDNGSAQTIAWGASFRASTDLPLPTTTNAGKYLYTLFIWNATLSQWVLLALLNNI